MRGAMSAILTPEQALAIVEQYCEGRERTHCIPVSDVLMALQERGLLRRWDQKALRLRKDT